MSLCNGFHNDNVVISGITVYNMITMKTVRRRGDVSEKQLEALVALAFDEQTPVAKRRKLASQILRYGSVSVGGFSSGPSGDLYAHELAEWQEMIRSAIGAIVDQGGWSPPDVLDSVQVRLLRRNDGSVLRLFGSNNSNDWRQRTILILSAVLEHAGEYLRRCPTCRKIYVRSGRRDYCTPACSQRRRSSKHYEAHKERILVQRAEVYAAKKLPAQARSRRLQRLATEVKTGGVKTPQVQSRRHKNARQSPRGKRRA